MNTLDQCGQFLLPKVAGPIGSQSTLNLSWVDFHEVMDYLIAISSPKTHLSQRVKGVFDRLVLIELWTLGLSEQWFLQCDSETMSWESEMPSLAAGKLQI